MKPTLTYTGLLLFFGLGLGGCDEANPCAEEQCSDAHADGKADENGENEELAGDEVVLPLGGGTWSAPTTAPLHFLHGALLHTGRVVMFSGLFNGETEQTYAVWDSESSTFSTHPLPGDLLCSHHAHLPDGDLLLMGGGGPSAFSQKPWAVVTT